MNRVSTNPSIYLVLVVATTLQFFVQPAHPLVLPGPKPECNSYRPTGTEEPLGNLHRDGTAGHSDSGHEACSKGCENHSSCDSFPLFIDRRQSLAKMAMVAPAFGAFPEMACASSSDQQHPSNNTNSKPRDRPIDPELSRAVQKLIDLDKLNRLVPGKDYLINVQGRKIKSNKGETKTNTNDDDNDAAPDPLFQYVDPAVFENRPTYKSFVALLDNYQPNVCLEEDNTAAETEEAYAFLRACMTTPVLRFCYSYCRSKLAEQESSNGVSSKPPKYSFDTEQDFVRILYKIWFQMYSRSGGCDSNNIKEDANSSSNSSDNAGEGSRKKVYGSSGFEHVFVGEIRKNKVIGFHNWIQLYRQELTGNLDYRGTTKSGSQGGGRVLTYNVRWNDSEKPIGTSLIGVSPEFELALYTMVFLVGNQADNILLLDFGDDHGNAVASASGSAGQGNNHRSLTKLDVKCFRSKGRVGSCYVELVS